MNIPESAVEAAAKALVMERSNGCCGVDWPKVCDDCDCFRDTSPDPFYYERKHAEAVLAAAGPLLLAPLQDENDRLRNVLEGVVHYYDCNLNPASIVAQARNALAAVPAGEANDSA